MSGIHTALLAAMRDVASIGIAKLGKNKDQNYAFRGVEQAMNEMSPILVRNKITVTPSYTDHAVAWSESKSGTKLRFVTLKGLFKFEAEDGSFVVGEAYGEGMDSSDKATTKAMSVAYRTALFQQFIAPTMSMDPELDGEPDPQNIPPDAIKAAEHGILAYQEFWKKLTLDRKRELEPHHESLKGMAKAADESGR